MTKTVIYSLVISYLTRFWTATEFPFMLGTQHHMHNAYASSFLEETESLLGLVYLAIWGRAELLWNRLELCCPSESSSTLLLQQY